MAITQVPTLDFTDEQLNIGDTTEFVAKMNSFMAEMEAWSQAVNNSRIDAEALINEEIAAGRNSHLNLVADHGTFIDAPSDPLTADGFGNNTALFTPGGFDYIFDGYNGSDFSAAIEAGRVYNNSSTFGGTETALNSVAQGFVNAMGSGYRYNLPWAIAETTAGSGTAGSSYNGCFRPFNTGTETRMGKCGSVSIAFWFQPVAENAYLRGMNAGNARRAYIDGVEVFDNNGIDGGPWHLIAADRICHIAGRWEAPANIHVNHTVTEILVVPSSKQRWACPWMIPGAVQLLPHPWPVRSMAHFGM